MFAHQKTKNGLSQPFDLRSQFFEPMPKRKALVTFIFRANNKPLMLTLLTMQGQLQIWTEHSTLIYENLKPVEKSKNHVSII